MEMAEQDRAGEGSTFEEGVDPSDAGPGIQDEARRLLAVVGDDSQERQKLSWLEA